MKRIIILAAFLLLTVDQKEAVSRTFTPVNLNYFYYELSPYGEWIQLDAGLIVWRPTTVDYNWAPYSLGNWMWTKYGWYWNSYEPFGWITYHYGRWIYDDYYGWIWFPDYEWAPAWVEWRYDDFYIGWAPLPPYASFSVKVGLRFTYNWHPSYHHWIFISFNHFGHKRMYNYYVSERRIRTFFGRTKVRYNFSYRNGRVVNKGISRTFIERRTGRRIHTRDLTFTHSKNRTLNSRANVIRVYEPDKRTVERYNSIRRDNIRVAKRTSVVREKVAVSREIKHRNSSRKYKGKKLDAFRVQRNYAPDRITGNKNTVKIKSSIKERKVNRGSSVKYKRENAIRNKSSIDKRQRRESVSKSRKKSITDFRVKKESVPQESKRKSTKRKSMPKRIERNGKRNF